MKMCLAILLGKYVELEERCVYAKIWINYDKNLVKEIN